MAIEIIDTKNATITGFDTGMMFFRSKPEEPDHLYVSFEVNGYNTHKTIKGEAFDKIMALIREAINE